MKSTDLHAPRIAPDFFAYGETAAKNAVGEGDSGFSLSAGIPPKFSSRFGQKVTRPDINGLFSLVSQAQVFNERGGFYTFSKEVSDAIGGYPEGAVLGYWQDDRRVLRTVRSMIPDNKYDFTENPEYIDGERWKFVDEIPLTGLRPRIYADFSNATVIDGFDVGETYVASGNEMVILHAKGVTYKDPSDDSDSDSDWQPPGKTDLVDAREVWAKVRKPGQEEFSPAAMVYYQPSTVQISEIITAHDSQSSADQFSLACWHSQVFEQIGYRPSAISIYLNKGDELRLFSRGNEDFTFSMKLTVVPLKA